MKSLIAIAFLMLFSGSSSAAAKLPAWLFYTGIRPVMNSFPPCYMMTCVSHRVKFKDSVAQSILLAICHKKRT